MAIQPAVKVINAAKAEAVRLALFPVIYVIRAGIEEAWSDVRAAFFRMTDELMRAFPWHPLQFLDAIIRFATVVPGILATVPMLGFKSLTLEAIKKAKAGNKLVRVDDFVAALFDQWIQAFRTVTGTDEDSLGEWLVEGFAKFLYRAFKRYGLLSIFFDFLIGAASEAEFVERVIEAYRTKFRIFRNLFVVMASAALLVLFSFGVWVNVFLVNSDLWAGAILAQDSKRTYVPARERAKQKRQNQQQGPDQL